jgi:hypothetical protein
MASEFRTYAKDNGGRVSLLFLLFLLAIYEFITAGFSAFAIICLIPFFVLLTITSFHYRMFLFWILITINYFIQMKDLKVPFPMSLPNEMLEILLIAIAIIDVKTSHFERLGNVMLFALLAWASFCTLQVLNNTCGLGINVGSWYSGARMMAFQLIYAFVVFIIYIDSPKVLIKYLFIWGIFALFAVFWVWKQQHIGLTQHEFGWLYYGAGRMTHLIQGGTLIRYWSIYSDAANFGVGIASTGIAFVIFGITAKIKRIKYFCLIVGGACIWGMFPSGTRTAIVCLMAGFMAYVFLSKSFKIAVPVTILFAFLAFILVFTNIGNGNQQIRRMRSAFNKKDASANTRTINQETMKKYMRDAPWGIGLGMGMDNVPANNKFRKMATIPPDSEYIFIWLRTGVVGITVFLICTAIMLFGACWIVFFQLKSSSLRGIGSGMCCAFVAIQLGGYGNQVLMQFPNCLVFYGGLSIVYILPWMEKDWIEWENKELAKIEEKKRLKLEKKRASRV